VEADETGGQKSFFFERKVKGNEIRRNKSIATVQTDFGEGFGYAQFSGAAEWMRRDDLVPSSYFLFLHLLSPSSKILVTIPNHSIF
jgi:hypothetical protein